LNVLQVLASFRSTFDCSRHRGGTHRARKTERLTGGAYSFLFTSFDCFFFCSSQHVQTDREPISHYNGCSQDGSKVKLTCPALSGSKNRARAWKGGKPEKSKAVERGRGKLGREVRNKFALCV